MESQRTQVFLHGLFMHLDSSITRLSGKIFVISVGLHCAIQVGNTACASIFASMLALDRVNVVGCLAALVGR